MEKQDQLNVFNHHFFLSIYIYQYILLYLFLFLNWLD